jgi:hypothetical protein
VSRRFIIFCIFPGVFFTSVCHSITGCTRRYYYLCCHSGVFDVFRLDGHCLSAYQLAWAPTWNGTNGAPHGVVLWRVDVLFIACFYLFSCYSKHEPSCWFVFNLIVIDLQAVWWDNFELLSLERFFVIIMINLPLRSWDFDKLSIRNAVRTTCIELATNFSRSRIKLPTTGSHFAS